MDYGRYTELYTKMWNLLVETTDLKATATELCTMRGYTLDSPNFEFFSTEFPIVKIASDSIDSLRKAPDEFGLFDKQGNFLLHDRFIIPVRDFEGNVLALIGWYPDDRKYITTPSKYFVRSALMLGLEQLPTESPTVIVEGVFDSLSLRAQGVTALSMMGTKCSSTQRALYQLMGQIIAIPDNDSVGQTVIQEDSWGIPLKQGKYLRWKPFSVPVGSSEIYVKDIDLFTQLYGVEPILQAFKEITRNVVLEVH